MKTLYCGMKNIEVFKAISKRHFPTPPLEKATSAGKHIEVSTFITQNPKNIGEWHLSLNGPILCSLTFNSMLKGDWDILSPIQPVRGRVWNATALIPPQHSCSYYYAIYHNKCILVILHSSEQHSSKLQHWRSSTNLQTSLQKPKCSDVNAGRQDYILCFQFIW